jgi:hypothetical protein
MKRPPLVARIVPLIMLFVVCASPSHAFRFAGAGAKVGMLDPEGSDGAPAVSAHMEFDQPGTQWHLMPSMMLWNSNTMTGLNGNLDMYYHFVPEGSATPYTGAGIGIDHFDPSGPDNGSTRLGLNLFGGVRFPMAAGHLFMEGRYTASRYSQISLMGGVTFIGR